MRGKRNNFWFEDDPEWQSLRQKQSADISAKELKSQQKELRKIQEEQARQRDEAAKAALGTPEEPSKVSVSVNMTLPRIGVKKLVPRLKNSADRILPDRLKSKLKSRDRKQLVLRSAVAVVAIVALLGTLTLLNTNQDKGKNGGQGVLADQTVKIDFKPLLPNGNSADTTEYKTALDGQNRPIYTFKDQIGTTDVIVTEQPLPDRLKTNTDSELERMAKDLYLTEVINQSNPKAYLGTSVKGPQTVIFTKNGLLVFIQSQAKLEKDQWSDYVTRLVE